MVEVTLETIQISLVSSHRIVVLKEVGSERYLPIWIGPCEAESISVGAKGIDVLRPLTHDLIVSVLDSLDAELLYISVNDLADNTFYATLVVNARETEVEIDARPSDAIAVAVRTGVPIYVADSVMDEAGVMPEKDIMQPITGDNAENLSIFRDFLSSLDFDDPQEGQG
jgi:uncharacterized protein